MVLLKVSVFAWRLLRNRLPTKDNLFARGVIPHGNNTCVAGCGDIKAIQHLFIYGLYSAALWGSIRSWLRISSVEPYRVSEHFYQIVYSAGGSRTCRSIMQLIWLCCVWVMWNERNSKVFKNTESTIHHL